ncbi:MULTISPECIES: transglutaminase domain-containing protein [Arthrobacter]|uniref:TransglutaminaseTgpA domain-containing protein n=2 Tax=Arthrobacter TaxID=1663 RepID=A0ABU9KSA5_9MICC|nr:transglutaminase domain-containing protein [Arthrobacter sp. YJM1]MDP5228331.1 transglutaminaseTgpA domain-containing protein [Arthrobacter sp. YJM1]
MSTASTTRVLKDGTGPAWTGVADAVVLFVLLGLGILGLHLSYGGDPRYLLAGLGGIVLGLGLAALSHRFRLGVLATSGTGLLAYFLFGSALATPAEALFGVLPSLDSLKTLLLGIVFSWKDMLTVGVPVGVSEDLLVVPFLAGLLCALAAGLLTWRAKNSLWPLLPVGVLFVVGVAFSTSANFITVPRGVALGALALVWSSWRRTRLRGADAKVLSSGSAHDAGAVRRARFNRLALGAAVLAGAVGVTAVAAPALSAANERQVLRNVVVPPFDPRNYITPLASFRTMVKDQKDKTLFEVKGLPKDGRVRLAALDSYNGTVYNVDPSGTGNFSKVGDARALSSLPQAPGSTDYTLDVTVGDYQGYFVPGGTRTVGYDFPVAGAPGAGLYFNQGSDTAISTQGLSQGEHYTVQVQEPPALSHGQLTQYGFAADSLPDPQGTPQALTQKAQAIVGDAPTPIDQVRQIESYFRTKGAFSNGLVTEGQVPSLSGHGAARIASLFTAKQMLGDDEQYATAMALVCRQLGIPARVVMGFYPDPKSPQNGAGTVPIKGNDVHAWVEVNFDRVGWVPFDPTPPKDNVPIPPDPEKNSKPKPQVLQPPPPPQEPAELPPDSQPEAADADQKKGDFWAILGPILATIGIVALPLAVLALPLVLVAFLKGRRRKNRSTLGAPVQRFSGGWSEVVSLATDLGTAVDPKATRRETSVVVGEAFPSAAAGTVMLAQRADAAVFGAGDPAEEDVAAYWSSVDQSLAGLTEGLGFWRRQRARFSPRSLLVDARTALESGPGGLLEKLRRTGRKDGDSSEGDAR